MFSVRIVDSLDELAELEAEWAELWACCPTATPFQRPEWVLSWCRQFSCNTIWTPILRREGRLVALAPWLHYRDGERRVIAFLAGGVSDYHDVLAVPDLSRAVIEQLFHCLLAARGNWDECHFEELAPWSALREFAPPPPFEMAAIETAPCPTLQLPARETGLAAVVPAGQLARFRKYRRRAERKGGPLRLRSGEDGQELDQVFRLHAARWESKGLAGMLTQPSIRAFHHEVLRRFRAFSGANTLEVSGVRIYTLELGEVPIGALYGLWARGVLYCYMQGIDPQFAELCPGLLLVGEVLERARQEGARTVDFLRGDEPYKIMWGGTGIANVRLRIGLAGRG